MLILTAAYGRKYLTLDEALLDWSNGLDFRVHPNGPYTSIRDLYMLHDRGYTVAIAAGDKHQFIQLMTPEPA